MGPLSAKPVRRPYGDHSSQFVDVILPGDDEPLGVILSLHGGYWRDTYGLDLHDPIVEHCVALGWAVVNAEYRRIAAGQGAVWHAMASDVHQGAMIARGIAGSSPLVALGHSAGGHLALWLAAQREVAIDAVVALAPVADLLTADRLQLSDHVTLDLLGVGSDEDPDLYREASPLHLLPLGIPQLVVHGPLDDRVPYEIAVSYVESARSLGDEVTFVNEEDIDHFTVIDPSAALWRHVDKFLSDQRPY